MTIYNILSVEANGNFRQTLRGLLDSRFSSMAFEEATEGKEALAKAKAFDPDIIFMWNRDPLKILSLRGIRQAGQSGKFLLFAQIIP